MYRRVPPPSDVEGKGNDSGDSETLNACKEPPKNVPSRLWERFKVLEKKTDDMTRRSTEKRIKYMQKSLMKKVQEEITLPEDRDILRQHDVKFGPPIKNDSDRLNRKRKAETSSDASTQDCAAVKTDCPSTASGSSWEDIKPYLAEGDHLKRPDKDFYKPESGLEGQITSAIKQGEFTKAEELSDQLSTRELGTKVAKAFDAHRFVEKRKEQEEFKKSKKKKNLHWGFQEKHRWETKGNM